MSPNFKSGSNLTMENWFTDVYVVEDLAGDGPSVVGMFKKISFKFWNELTTTFYLEDALHNPACGPDCTFWRVKFSLKCDLNFEI